MFKPGVGPFTALIAAMGFFAWLSWSWPLFLGFPVVPVAAVIGITAIFAAWMWALRTSESEG